MAKKGRIAGIDYGRKRIGIAMSDDTKIIALPLKTLHVDGKMAFSVKALLDVLKDYSLEKVILGNPLKMSGQASLMADEVQHFAGLLKEGLSCELVLWDERLSSLQAERSLKEANLSRKQRTGLVDTVASVILLQSYLDCLRNTAIPAFEDLQ